MAGDMTIRREVDGRLREAIQDGLVLPGANVSIAGLARRWSISETPVREACWNAVGAGLLASDPNGGFKVWSPTIDGLRDAFQCLELLLVGAIGLCDVNQAKSRMPEGHKGVADGEAHEMAPLFIMVAASTANRELLHTISRLLDRLAIFRAAEATLGVDRATETRDLLEAWGMGSRAMLREQVRRYTRRRHVLAPAILGLIEEWRRHGRGA
jgi:DNA-binding GntR family transcriptional regulator